MTTNTTSQFPSGRYSPLRYPGGKGKLARFVAELIKQNALCDGTYVEPYAGGAAIAWELLLSGIVRRVEINDVNRAIFSFWHSVLENTDEFIKKIQDTVVDVGTWDAQKKLLMNSADEDNLCVGFAMFFLNRTNRSGILNGGMIGGRSQAGEWKIDARFNKRDLIARIKRIAQFKKHIRLSNQDAIVFLDEANARWKRKTLVYLDPPYFNKGSHLYYDYYRKGDHQEVANKVLSLRDVSWIVSYDDVLPIQSLYNSEMSLQYTIGYSARNVQQGREAMFFSEDLVVPSVVGAMHELHRALPGGEMLPPPLF